MKFIIKTCSDYEILPTFDQSRYFLVKNFQKKEGKKDLDLRVSLS